MNEVVQKQDFLTITFGLLPGWWAFGSSSDRQSGSPLLSVESWNRILVEAGFGSVVKITQAKDGAASNVQDVMVAFKSEIQHSIAADRGLETV